MLEYEYTAMITVFIGLQHQHLFGSAEHSSSVLIDVIKILSSTTATEELSSHSDFLQAALSDLYRLFEVAGREFKVMSSLKKQDEKSPASNPEVKRVLKHAARKVFFFLSYVTSDRDELAGLIVPLQLEHGEFLW